MLLWQNFENWMQLNQTLENWVFGWLWRRWGRQIIVESKSFKCEGNRNDHLMHYEQDFDNACERSESECCGVLIKYLCKVEDEQVINLQKTQ